MYRTTDMAQQILSVIA